MTTSEKDPEAVASNDGPLSLPGQSSVDHHSNSPKEPAEELEAISFIGALRIPVSAGMEERAKPEQLRSSTGQKMGKTHHPEEVGEGGSSDVPSSPPRAWWNSPCACCLPSW